MNYYDVIGAETIIQGVGESAKINKVQAIHPNGLLSLAAYICHHTPSLNVKILDFNIVIDAYVKALESGSDGHSRELFWDFCVSELDDFNPDLIGITALFSGNLYDLNPLADFLRYKYPESIITCGGHLPSACYDEIFRRGSSIDALCFGEGEIPFMELSQVMSKSDKKVTREFFETDDSWITKRKLQNNSFIPKGKFIYDLDEIPPYNFDIIINKKGYASYSSDLFSIVDKKNANQFSIFTTRGCPGRCVFCASQHVHGNLIRKYSVNRIKQDILLYREKWNIDYFIFYDDHFLADNKRAAEILEFVIDNKIKSAVTNIAFFSVDQKLAALLKKAGNDNVLICIESGNEDTLRNIIRKPANLDKAKKAVECLRGEGIIVYSNIVIGLPGETKESIDKGIQGLLDLCCDWYLCYVAAPLPGSELYNICKENDYLVNDVDVFKMDYKRCLIETPDFDPDYIEKKVYEINLFVNFINNYNLRTENYETALKLFERVIDLVMDTHAFAYYFAAICADKLKMHIKYKNYKEKYEELVDNIDFWREWSEYFRLEKLE